MLARIALAAAALAVATPGLAQEFPSRVVKIIVPQAAGGTTDVIGRAVAGKLAEIWKQTVIVENVAGGSGAVGTRQVSNAAPDGYTLLVTYEGSQAMNPHVIPNQGFDPIKDFTLLATVARAGFMIIASPKLPVKDFKEYLALAREKPDALTYGSSGSGSANHLIGELLKSQANVRIRHIPYRGAAQAITDVMGSQIDSAVSSIPSVIGQIGGGAVRPLAVTSAKRSLAAPDIPTIAESGVPGFDVTPWWGILAPPKMDPALIAKITRDVQEMLRAPDIKETFEKQGAEVFVTTQPEFAKLLADDLEKWGKIVAKIDLK
jgi:tripartite-type tricarboxylate transporter receptor subunit TctC